MHPINGKKHTLSANVPGSCSIRHFFHRLIEKLCPRGKIYPSTVYKIPSAKYFYSRNYLPYCRKLKMHVIEIRVNFMYVILPRCKLK